jgi:RNA polymerase sigma-B factor
MADPGVLFLRWTRFQDERAREELVGCFLPLARSLARRYARANVPVEDLIQVASLGLLKAIDRFDPRRGVAFSSYAVPTIVGELKRYFRDSTWAVHVPRGAQERANKVRAAEQALARRDGRAVTIGELAQYLGLSDEQVRDSLEIGHAYSAVSLDAPRGVQDDSAESYADTIGEEDPDLAVVDATVTVRSAIKTLPERDRRILHLRFVEERTQNEIGARIGLSGTQVSRVLRKTLQHLSELTEDTNLCA